MPSTVSKNKLPSSWQFEALGTHWSIETPKPLDSDVEQLITERIADFDLAYSRFRRDSLVGKIASKAGTYQFPPDAEKLIEFYRELYKATDGTVSPLVGNALVDAGYDMYYSLRPMVVNKVPKWEDVMEWSGATVKIKRPATLDFGAAGKGYLVDELSELLESNGYDEYVIDASGDMRTRGEEQVVGLENPHDPERILAVAIVRNQSMCASAINRRVWGRWNHVINPKTLMPARDIVATWVVAPTTYVADGLATALFFVEPEQLRDWDFEYFRLWRSGRIEHSPGFVGELYV